MNSHRHPIHRVSLTLLLGLASTAFVAAAAEHDNAKLLAALPKSKLTLAQGIQQAAQTPAAVISAKFELDDKGALSLSVYTADKGLGVEPEQNVLKELAGIPEGGAWKPEAEVFKDVEHVSRSSEHLTLAALSPHPLAHIVAQAEKDQPGGTVFSITPALKDQKPVFVVLVADKGKVVELNYDLMTGQKK